MTAQKIPNPFSADAPDLITRPADERDRAAVVAYCDARGLPRPAWADPTLPPSAIDVLRAEVATLRRDLDTLAAAIAKFVDRPAAPRRKRTRAVA